MQRPVRILVPTDFSPAAECAAKAARLMARYMDGDLTVLHVAPLNGSASLSELDAISDNLDRLVEIDWSIRVRPVLLRGDVLREILWLAREEWKPDMIVMGTRHAPFWRRSSRRLSKALQREAPCPVLTVSVPRNSSAEWLEDSQAAAAEETVEPVAGKIGGASIYNLPGRPVEYRIPTRQR